MRLYIFFTHGNFLVMAFIPLLLLNFLKRRICSRYEKGEKQGHTDDNTPFLLHKMTHLSSEWKKGDFVNYSEFCNQCSYYFVKLSNLNLILNFAV